MLQRGRKTTAALTVVLPVPMQRPEPPTWLPADQASLWREVTSTKPPAFFDAAVLPLLESYCVHCTVARGLAADLAALPAGAVAKRAKLLALFDTATRAALAHARSLRITTQSRITKGAAATAHNNTGARLRKPWET
jgi:phage terminase small subunit